MAARRVTSTSTGTQKVSLDFDPESLTVGELEDFADAAGMEFSEASYLVDVEDGKGGTTQVRRMKAKGLVALVYILRRRTDPSFTLEDARQVKIADFNLPPAAAKRANPTRART